MANTAPLLTGITSPVTFAEDTVNVAPKLIDSNVTFTDPDNNFNGGTLTVSGLLAEDAVTIRHQGTAAGQIGVSGSDVTFGGAVIGSFTGGTGSTLTVTFNASATAAAIDALIQNLTYGNSSDAPAATRTLTIAVTDTGSQTFTETNAQFAYTPVFIKEGDVDGDGDLDRIETVDLKIHYYKNIGSATAPVYEEQTGAANPFDGIRLGSFDTTALSDVDGDGDLDLVTWTPGPGGFFYNFFLNSGNIATAATVTVVVTQENDAPKLTDVSSAVTFAENTVNAAPQLIDANVTFTDPENNFDGGRLTVSGLLPEDVVAIRQNNGGPGEITFSGPSVFYGVEFIGTSSGGNGTPFTVTFNASATSAAIEALIENLTYANNSNTPTAERTLSILVTDNAGLTTATTAVPAFTERTGTDSPFTGISVFAGDSAPSLADVDSDGDLDLVLGGYDGTLSYYKNTGTATAPVYTAQTGAANPFDAVNVGRYATSSLGDLDGDGDLDLVVGQEDGNLFYYKNTGTATAPVFTVQTGAANPFNGFSVGRASAPSLADVNGDGKIDLVLGESGGTLLYYQNTGTATVPAFTLQTGAANPFNGIDIGLDSAPSLGDVDGDGDLDLVAGQYDGNLFYYKNTGTTTAPVFTVQTGAANPFTGIDVGDPAGLSTPSLGDIDGDGDLDVVVGEYDAVLNYFENTSGTRVKITVTPENDAPTLNRNSGLTMAEGASSVITSLKLGYSDVEQTDSQLVYTITSQTAGTVVKNNVVLATGQTFTQLDIDGGLVEFRHDGSEGASAGFAFSLSDGTATINSAFDITVTPVNDAPTAVSFTNAVTAVAENTLTQVKLADIGIADVDGGTNTLFLSGSDAAAFEIIGSALFLKAGTALDFETKKTYTVTVNVDDTTVGATPDASKVFTFSVTDVNEAPTALAFSNVLASIAENASTAARRKIADFTVTDDALGTETITLSGTDASKFEISDGDIYLKAGATLDFETNPKLDVTVNVDDTTLGSGIELSRALSVTVTDVIETISGSSGSNTLTGTSGADRINAGAGNDTVNGGAGDDIIYGGAGVDSLTGGTGRDTFVFKSITESGYRASGSLTEGGPLTDQAAIGQRDIITDFTPGFDKIDLSDIDANTNLSGNQAFTFRGTGALSSAGSLVYRKFDNAGTASDRTIIFADANGDGRSDFQIELTGLKTLAAGDFVL